VGQGGTYTCAGATQQPSQVPTGEPDRAQQPDTHLCAILSRTSDAASASTILATSDASRALTPAALGLSSQLASSHSWAGSKSEDLLPSRSRFSRRFQRKEPSCGG
jgi:hypothetical protein